MVVVKCFLCPHLIF